eukprot:scaffold126378_cov72-Phaeocystis_antarctica.AAC.1
MSARTAACCTGARSELGGAADKGFPGIAALQSLGPGVINIARTFSANSAKQRPRLRSHSRGCRELTHARARITQRHAPRRHEVWHRNISKRSVGEHFETTSFARHARSSRVTLGFEFAMTYFRVISSNLR